MNVRVAGVVGVLLAVLSCAIETRGQAPMGRRAGPPIRPAPIRQYPAITRYHPYLRDIYGPRASFPVWLRTSARSLRALYPAEGLVRTVSVDGTSLQVAEPKPIVVSSPATTPTDSSASAQPAGAKTPFTEFALLVEKRARDLEATINAAAQSQEGITEIEGHKFCKAYTCVYLTDFEVKADWSGAGQHTGKISYATRVMVQLGDTKEAVTATAGYPDEGSQVLASSESYVYRDGKWEYKK